MVCTVTMTQMMMHFSIVTWLLNNANAKSWLVIEELSRNGGIRLFWKIILLCPFLERVTHDPKGHHSSC